nr:hypothetical protein [Microbacterium sp. NIBRBAC000506063]
MGCSRRRRARHRPRPGPRADWFTPAASDALFDAEWTVSNQSDRVGMRLDGPELPRFRGEELPSEGMLLGSLQVPRAAGR